jgi:probable addiction module antidote protein
LNVKKAGLNRRPFFAEYEMSNKPEKPSVDLSENVEDRINKALQSSDMIAVCEAIGDALRRHTISDIAKRAGLRRTSIYRAFGGQQSPNFSTVLRVLDAMGLQLKVAQRRHVRKAQEPSPKDNTTTP